MITLASTDTAAHLAAGRRAAFAELRALTSQATNVNWQASEPEQYQGATTFSVNGWDFTPVVDAAILETIVRLQPDMDCARAWGLAARMPKPWGRRMFDLFWHSFTQTLWAGVPLLVTFAGLIACLNILRWAGMI